MEYMHELKDKLCDELEEIARKGELGAGDLEIIHKLTDTIKNIDKIEMMKEDGGYSQVGDWEIEGRAYNRGNSYRGRKRDSMGRYSRDDRYSRDGDRMMEEMESLLDRAGSEKERQAIRRCMQQMES